MISQGDPTLCVEDTQIPGYAQTITLRSYRTRQESVTRPIVLYFHGGSFTEGSLEDANVAASTIAKGSRAWVICVGYSLAPDFPFPAALEDGYLALKWAVKNARAYGADMRRIAVGGHDAGGNLATCLSAITRDRKEFMLSAQALLAPLLDPSMTLVSNQTAIGESDAKALECAHGYRSYFTHVSQRMHPYAAPIESKRLRDLPPALIASAEDDFLHVEAERYSCELIAAGVSTEATRYRDVSHNGLAAHPGALSDVVAFLSRKLKPRAGKK